MPLLFFFFSSRRRHTRFDCDWSSDVCSSDLQHFLLDVLLVNTCAVRDHAEQKVLSRLGELKVYKRRDTVLGVVGCMAQRLGPPLLERAPPGGLGTGPPRHRGAPPPRRPGAGGGGPPPRPV